MQDLVWRDTLTNLYHDLMLKMKCNLIFWKLKKNLFNFFHNLKKIREGASFQNTFVARRLHLIKKLH